MKPRNFLWVLFFSGGAVSAWAVTSPLVPLNDWTYSAVQKLAVCGFANSSPLSSKPLTRIQMAKIVAEAIDHIQNDDLVFSPLEDIKGLELLMDGLMQEYQKELADLGVSVAEIPGTKHSQKKHLRIQFPERVYLQKLTAGLEKGRTLLLENQGGWRIHKGFNFRADTSVYGQWDDWLTVVLSPTLRMTKSDIRLLMEQFYAETEWKNLRVTLGRQSFWWGPGYHGALVLSNNAFSLNAIRLSSSESYQLPGFLKRFGNWRTDFFLANLGAEQDIKRPKFSGLRQEWIPADWLSIGGSHTIIFGGKGAHRFTGLDLFDSYFKSESGDPGETENHLAGWDWKLTIPQIDRWIPLSRGVQVYGEYSFEDAGVDFNLITLKASASTLHGIYLPELFKICDLDFRAEFAQIDAAAYEHFFYRTGYRHKGEFLGYSTGPDSRDFYLQVKKKLNDVMQESGDVEVGIDWDLQQSGIVRQPAIQTLSELSFFFSRPGPWGLLLKTAFTVLQWKNFDHKNTPVDTDLLLSLEAVKKW